LSIGNEPLLGGALGASVTDGRAWVGTGLMTVGGRPTGAVAVVGGGDIDVAAGVA